ncbi:MAG TPA: hypothetical protein P5056_02940 [Candidatus Paceibacterota bacterium]|nr:hypothetical protein [Candidatus Paceibacterota bacterium]
MKEDNDTSQPIFILGVILITFFVGHGLYNPACPILSVLGVTFLSLIMSVIWVSLLVLCSIWCMEWEKELVLEAQRIAENEED